ncbi:MAG: hypothetical protein DRJ10_08150, partial [Bacteroidetes bacterium]
MIKKVIPYSLIIVSFSLFGGVNAQSELKFDYNQVDDTSKVKFNLGQFLTFTDTLFNIKFRTRPNTALNYKRFTLESDQNENLIHSKKNISIQQSIDESIATGTNSG